MTRAFGIVLGVIVIAGVAFFLGSNVPVSREEVSSAPTSSDVTVGSSTPSGTEIVVTAEEPIYFESVKGYYAAPGGEGDYPGVLMIHEWWGLNDSIRETARRLANEGYRVLAVDLFGKVASTSSEAQAQVKVLDQAKALQNLRAGIAYLRGRGARKLASFGWCFGGGQSVQLSLSGEKLDGTVVYYGNLVTDKSKLKTVSWPVLGIFGDQDKSVTTSSVSLFRDALNELKVPNEIYVYPGVGHAFANPTGQNFAPKETEDAWMKTLLFLSRNLKGEDSRVLNEAVRGSGETQQTPLATRAGEGERGDRSEIGIKEFSMTSYYEVKDGKPRQYFSLKEMAVKKGDAVRIKVKNIKGMHDFVIDEYNIKKETPLNEEVVIEFTADRAGEFVYYCSKPGHRVKGQWGTLRVTE